MTLLTDEQHERLKEFTAHFNTLSFVDMEDAAVYCRAYYEDWQNKDQNNHPDKNLAYVKYSMCITRYGLAFLVVTESVIKSAKDKKK